MIVKNTGSETNIKLPFSFIFFSILALLISQFLILFNGDAFINGHFRIPAIWSAAHLFILGWALMIAMGAMYQLVPVAFLTPIWNEKFGFIQFAVTAVGVVSFAIALYIIPSKALIPGIIMLIGIIMFLIQMGMTLRKQAKPNILTLFVGSALVCLFLTIIMGISLVFSMKTGFASNYYSILFHSHLLLGISGWFTLLIFGFSYKMAPMFSLSHGYEMKQAKYVYGFYSTGLLFVLLSFVLDFSWLFKCGFFLLLVGFSSFMWHIYLILKKRVKKKLDLPFRFALLAIIFGEMIHLLAFIACISNQFASLAAPLIVAYIMLWIAYSIIGYLYKIVPFLWWTHKYSHVIGKKDVPALKDMINEKLALPIFLSFIFGILLVSISIALNGQMLFYIGQLLVTAASIVFGIAILAVIKK
ncbi:hypothetical protein PZE06_06230 [Robertmurraya sp. DFI.2.37]|uniref:hypothetical protein n=1 Tax=Robertmurraya sp. DFI.2.37 TaxID=3031819 RepID=UPI00177EFFC8|nr:hypothetical protein [Robertmurraya sp. DFI.2.37]MDF1507779.1 hypothetical protein [Robertmurraya sp. DFI.2.37]